MIDGSRDSGYEERHLRRSVERIRTTGAWSDFVWLVGRVLTLAVAV